VVAVGRHEKNMQTNCSTLSSFDINPRLVNPKVMKTPRTGETTVLRTARVNMAPTGKFDHPLWGKLSLANADPKQISPKGTEAAPMKVAKSNMNASGGSPSGAFGICEFAVSVKRPLSEGTRAMGIEMIIESDAGVKVDLMIVVSWAFVRFRRLPDGGGPSSFSEGMDSFSRDSYSESCAAMVPAGEVE